MVNLGDIVRSIWEQTGDIDPTDHQKVVQNDLDPDANLRIYGDIGVGKTFTIRHYLRNNNIAHEYLTAQEVAEMDAADLKPDSFDAAETVVIDNFDVIKRRRDELDQVYQIIELYIESASRGVWMVFPTGYEHDWFDTVTGNYTDIIMESTEIDQFAIDKVRNNINSVVNADYSLDFGGIGIEEYGYHDVVKAYASE